MYIGDAHFDVTEWFAEEKKRKEKKRRSMERCVSDLKQPDGNRASTPCV
jgi:hypothetical protein